MFSASFPSCSNSEHLFEIPSTSHVLEHSYSTPGAIQRASINKQCLDGFLCHLQEEISANAKAYPQKGFQASIWEFVNGSAINIDNLRLVLIPTLAMDGDELRVPQEWVDIPEWVGDYYLAIQVNPDEEYIRVYGYTTHYALKNVGVYDVSDRTYSLVSDDLIEDLNILWLSQQFNPEEVTRVAIQELPPLPKAQADNLLQRLGNADIKLPRLEVPFQVWGRLLSHSGWRQQMYELRQGAIQTISVWQWLEEGVSNFAEQLGWVQREFIAAPTGMRNRESDVGFSKELLIAGNTYEIRFICKGAGEEKIWRFELKNSQAGNLIPKGFKLRLLTEDLQDFANNQDIASDDVETLYVEVMLEDGEALVWEVEPTPEGYERELLRF